MDSPEPDQIPAPQPDSKPSEPLLPRVLLQPAALIWLWLLPISLLLLLNLQGYWLIEGNMDADQRHRAWALGACGLVNLLCGIALYGIGRFVPDRPGSRLAKYQAWSLVGAVVQVVYLWLASSWAEDILPASVVAWIYPPPRYFFNQYAFAMLPLALCVLRIACARPVANVGRSIAINLSLTIGAPVLLYAVFTGLSTFATHHDFLAVFYAVAIVLLGLTMFVGLVRVLMLGLRGTQRWGASGERVAIALFALVLPICGLLLNRTIPFPVDFQAWEVYALVVANTAILLLASFEHARHPRLSFNLLCATLPFSLYFFVVFLPYTPLSILAVIVMGSGFLVLAPTFLFTLHLHLLNKSIRNQLPDTRRMRTYLAGLAAFLLLPAFFVARGVADKTALNAALDYVFTPTTPSGDLHYPGNRLNLRRALDSHRNYKNGIYYPLLSDFYAWLVFDNLVLPDDKLDRLEQVFFGSRGTTENVDPLQRGLGLFGARSVRARKHMPRSAPLPHDVAVDDLQLHSRSSGASGTEVTLVLTLKNTNEGARVASEYVRALPVRAGMFVSGFRLQTNGATVPGRLFEKKTALWVYTMIRDSERRDPGLLFYNSDTELQLSVFPVAPEAPVTVEIDFLLPGAIWDEALAHAGTDPALALEHLGDAMRPEIAASDQGIATVGLDSLDLPAADRPAYLHLIIDRSQENGFAGDFATAMKAIQVAFPEARQARITLANYDLVDLVGELTALDHLPPCDPHALDRALPRSGGLDLDLAVAHAIRAHRDLDLDSPAKDPGAPPRPIFVLLSRNGVSQPDDYRVSKNWADVLPSLEIHQLREDGTFLNHPVEPTAAVPLLRFGPSMRPLVAHRATRFRTPGDDEAKLEYWSQDAGTWFPLPDVHEQAAPSAWSEAMAMRLEEQDHARSPGDAASDLRALVASSRKSGILLASTSYIVVENEAQWRMLEASERQKLGQNEALDFLETPAPPGLLIALCFVLWLWVRRRLPRPARTTI